MDHHVLLPVFIFSLASAEPEPLEAGTPLPQAGPPAVRSPVQSSQQATVFLVNNWNNLSTWKPGSKVLSVCEEHVEQNIKGYIANQMWALQVFDAWGKPGPSLLEGRWIFIGNYHQCRGIQSPAVNNGTGFGGNYCVVTLLNLTNSGVMELFLVKIGTCLPDTCTNDVIKRVFQERLKAMNLSSFFKALSTDCLSDEREVTAFTIIALLIVLVIGCLVISGTSIDLAAQIRKSVSRKNTTEGLIERKQESNTQDTDVWMKVLLSFSAYTNGKRLLSTSMAPGSISIIPGLRFLTMSWIVFGHVYLVLSAFLASNAFQGNMSLIRYRIFDIITNMPLGVDTFFVISGFLLSYLNMKKVLESGWNYGWIHYFLHRYWRLTPTYMVALILIVGLQRFFVSGPTAATVQPFDKVACEKYWWTLPLYINNLMRFGQEDTCLIHSWSLAADYQFHLLSPLMLVPFYYNINCGIASCLFFTVLQMILCGSLAYYFKMQIGIFGQPVESLNEIYFPFYARMGPFALGILTGYIMSANNGCVSMNKGFVVIGWILATVAWLAVLFGVHGDLSGESRSSLWVVSFYTATFRTVWGACVCWLIVACTSGYGGPITTFLSWSPFTVLGRLTYTGYLIHVSILTVMMINLEQMVYLNMFSVVVYGTVGVVFTCVLSAIVFISVEIPTLNLEKVLDHKKKV